MLRVVLPVASSPGGTSGDAAAGAFRDSATGAAVGG